MLPAAAPPTSAIKSLWIENQIYVTRLLAHWHRFCDNSSSGPVGPRQTIFLQQLALCVSNLLLNSRNFSIFHFCAFYPTNSVTFGREKTYCHGQISVACLYFTLTLTGDDRTVGHVSRLAQARLLVVIMPGPGPFVAVKMSSWYAVSLPLSNGNLNITMEITQPYRDTEFSLDKFCHFSNYECELDLLT